MNDGQLRGEHTTPLGRRFDEEEHTPQEYRQHAVRQLNVVAELLQYAVKNADNGHAPGAAGSLEDALDQIRRAQRTLEAH